MPATLQRETRQHLPPGCQRHSEQGRARPRAGRAEADIGWIPGGKVRLLVVLDKFEGWDGLSNWSDLTFFVRYSDNSSALPSSATRWRDTP